MKFLLKSSMAALALISCMAQAENKTFGSWSLICSETKQCAISQLVTKDKQATQVLLGASINLFFGKETPALLLRLPANTYQKAGIGIKVDDNKAIRVKIANCDADKCESLIKLDNQLLHELKNGKMVQIAIAIQDKKQLTLPLVLDGFSQAYQALQANAS